MNREIHSMLGMSDRIVEKYVSFYQLKLSKPYQYYDNKFSAYPYRQEITAKECLNRLHGTR